MATQLAAAPAELVFVDTLRLFVPPCAVVESVAIVALNADQSQGVPPQSLSKPGFRTMFAADAPGATIRTAAASRPTTAARRIRTASPAERRRPPRRCGRRPAASGAHLSP